MHPAKEIIAELSAEHMPRPAHNMFAAEIWRALDKAGFVIVRKGPADNLLRVALGVRCYVLAATGDPGISSEGRGYAKEALTRLDAAIASVESAHPWPIE